VWSGGWGGRYNQRMTRTRIKICGIKDVEMARVCVEAGADAIGLMFAKGSAREVTAERAGEIVGSLPAFVTAVGVFVDMEVQDLRDICRVAGIRQVQLHGSESVGYARGLMNEGYQVMKVLGAKPGFEGRLEEWRSRPGEGPKANGLIVDTPGVAGAGAGGAGGTGKVFDWEGLAAMRRAGHWKGLPELVLAGGLTPENVGKAVEVLSPYGVDVSSGVESARGVKDAGLIRAFCRAAGGGG
jgi:phosphoribosylanthranilate isomerase